MSIFDYASHPHRRYRLTTDTRMAACVHIFGYEHMYGCAGGHEVNPQR
ncbi:MAG: hypothetical protein ACRDHN_01460 [Thermomicrobiales bacterium]